jgi:hypothetical protein
MLLRMAAVCAEPSIAPNAENARIDKAAERPGGIELMGLSSFASANEAGLASAVVRNLPDDDQANNCL